LAQQGAHLANHGAFDLRGGDAAQNVIAASRLLLQHALRDVLCARARVSDNCDKLSGDWAARVRIKI
jgi:hypothetical protein